MLLENQPKEFVSMELILYRISIWRLDLSYGPALIHSFEIKIEPQIAILNNQVSFSNNGEFVYFLLVNEDEETLEKAIVLSS